MIPVSAVLLPVQHLQQGRAGVAPVIRAHLVDFVQQEHGVTAARLNHGGHNPARHSAHIGLPVAPDIGLIVYAAQRHPGHLPVQGLGDGVGNGGLAHAGRADKAQNLGRHLGRHLPHGDGFQNPLLHLFHAEVVFFQNFPGGSHVHTLFRLDIPGQLQHGVQIIAQNGPFRRTEGLLFEPLHILQKLLFHILIQFQAPNAGGVAFALVFIVLFPQLLPDDLHLLAQIVIPLVLIQSGLGLLLNLRFYPEHFHLPLEQPQSRFQPPGGVQHT